MIKTNNSPNCNGTTRNNDPSFCIPNIYQPEPSSMTYHNDGNNSQLVFISRCNAKFLWKRIPPSITSSNPEIAAIWAVGQKLWKKDLAGTYQALAAYNWTEPVANIIRALEGNCYIHYEF